jgi:uncharacterized spore protein YtfJ
VEGIVSVPELLKFLADSSTAKIVYGDPVTAEGRTVVPVARIAYGFGVGQGKGDERGGGGGGMRGKPVGVIEITAGGTRFIPIGPSWHIAAAAAAGFALGLLVGGAEARQIRRAWLKAKAR